MELSVIGCGYLGAVHAVGMAHLGHKVVGLDVDSHRISFLAAGKAPFFEPQLPELLSANLEAGRLCFSTDMSVVKQASVHFIAVGTPQRPGTNSADLSYVESAIDSLLPHLKRGDLVVGKSTVPIGTAARLAERVTSKGATLAWNPEFLREGFAVKDTLLPDRLVYGVPSGSEGNRAVEILDQIYAKAISSGTPRLVTDFATSELVKVAANAFLATKISFINAMAEIAEATGADVKQLADAIGYDKRIGREFLGAGLGFGGGCLPKDIRAFTARAEELGRASSVAFLKEVDAINLRRRDAAVEMVVSGLGGSVVSARITVLGAAFKPFSDDIRDSPALDVALRLYGLGADVVVTDPQALANARLLHPELNYEADRDTAITGADALILATEWDEYRRDLSAEHASSLTLGRLIVDGRNCLNPAEWQAFGWRYRGMGRVT